MEYVGLSDLYQRWSNYTKAGVRYFIAHNDDFPRPAFTINGTMKVWRLAEIKDFESYHPELFSQKEKRAKVVGYAVANLKKIMRQG
jgi:hypothetical protein